MGAAPVLQPVFEDFEPMDYLKDTRKVIIQNEEQMKLLDNRLANATQCYWDVETTGLFAWTTLKNITKAALQSMTSDVLEEYKRTGQIKKAGDKWYHVIPPAKICGHAIRVGQWSYYIPIFHENVQPDHQFQNVDDAWVEQYVLDHFMREDMIIINHNIKFDLHILRAHYAKKVNGVIQPFVPKAKVRDTMVLAHLCNENSWEWNKKGRPIFQLKVIGKRFYGEDADDQEQFLKAYMRKHKLERYSQIPIHILGPYAIRDVDLVFSCYEGIMADLEKQWEGDTIGLSLERLIEDDHEYLRILEEVYSGGIHVNRELTQQYFEEAVLEMAACREAIKVLYGQDLNPSSPKKVAEAIGVPNAKEQTLSEFIANNPDTLEAKIAQKVREYKMWEKVKGSFYGVYLSLADENGFIHPEMFQVATVTSRLACRTPNFQALPRANDADELTTRVYKVRNVVNPPGQGEFIHMYADYSQIEMNISTIYVEDNEMKYAIMNGIDIHTNAAENVFGKQTVYDQVTGKIIKRFRSMAKAINFGTIYGMGAYSFCLNLKNNNNIEMTRKEASEILEKWHQAFIGFRRFYGIAEAVARITGEIRMWTGRRRRFINPDTGQLYPKTQYRKAMNNIVQGAVAEMVKQAAIRINRILKSQTASGLSRLVNFIHDDINMYIHITDFHLIPAIKAAMEDFPIFSSSGIPVKVDVEYANWKQSWGNKAHWKPDSDIREVFGVDEDYPIPEIQETPTFTWDLPVKHYTPTIFKQENFEPKPIESNTWYEAIFAGVSVSTTKYGDPYAKFEWTLIDDPSHFGKSISSNVFLAGRKTETFIDDILKVIEPIGVTIEDLVKDGKILLGDRSVLNEFKYRRPVRITLQKSVSNGREYYNLKDIAPMHDPYTFSDNIPAPIKIA